jgi:murein L,D-transpeptidase YcbB/YkuD
MKLCFFIPFILFFFVSCNNHHEANTVKADSPQDLAKEVEKELSALITNDSLITVDSSALLSYRYFKPHYSNTLLWFNQAKLSANGDSLFRLIQKSAYYGLNAKDYHFLKIKQHIDSISIDKKYINVSALVKADILLSDAYFMFGAHVNKGRFYPDSLLLQTNFSKLQRGWDSLLWAGYTKHNIKASLDSLEPKNYNYRMLKKELASILNNPVLYQLDSIPFVSDKDPARKQQLIIKNLSKQGLYDTLNTLSDSLRLAAALDKLQRKWYIQPDGKLGKYTKQALSYNREKIIKQISMAMERWRWESKFPDRYAIINIPAFWLIVFEKDTVVMQSAIVCGKPETQTPILSSKINQMLIYPYWNVPVSIATKEILPAVQRDTTYLRRKNFEVLGKGDEVLDYTKVPWRKYTKDYLPVRFRQRIGDDNSLGVVKFNFYNPYGVYLHDTNSKRYFKTSSRAQSHGCIRLEKFTEFADFLIRDDSVHYTHDSLQVYFAKQEQRKLALRKPLPIYTRYFTAHADSNGLKLYIDVYRKDEEMMKMIYR